MRLFTFHPSIHVMSVRRSLAWTYLAQVASFIVTFGSTVMIARIVSPRDFGVFAMATAVATIINVFMQFGLAKYVTREKEMTQDILRSVFTVNVMMTSFYVTAILIGSVAAGRLFGSPEVGRFMLVFAIFPLFAMMEFVPEALCIREMRFGAVAAVSVARAIVLAVTTLALAYNGFAYMSFAWAQVFAWAVTAICFNAIIWRPDVWRLRFTGIRKIFGFGAQMIGISGVGQLSTRAGEMALGSMLGLTPLGLYTRAAGLPSSLYTTVYAAGSNVIFSRLSRELRETGALHVTYLRFMRMILGLLWPMLIGLAVVAQPVIHIVYGAKWHAAAVPLSLLAIGWAVTLGIGMTSELFVLRHQTHRQVKFESFKAVAGFAMFAAGALISLPAAAAAKLGEAVLGFILYRKPMAALIGGPASEMRGAYAEGLWLSLAATLPSLALMVWSGWSELTPLPMLIASIGLGGVLWTGLLWQRQHPIALEVVRLFHGEA